MSLLQHLKIVPRQIKYSIERLVPGSKKTLNYIHIGKCGGETVWHAINNSPRLFNEFDKIHKTHVRKPAYKKETRYLFVIRNPIDRALSAFNWRYKLVVDEKRQQNRFPGEYETLRKYRTLETLANQLYVGDQLQASTVRDIGKICHLREDLNFYLDRCFEVIRPEQIYGVICQKTMNADIEKYLGVINDKHIHENKRALPTQKVTLSKDARAHLGRYLHKDFECIEKLHALFPLEEETLADLMRI